MRFRPEYAWMILTVIVFVLGDVYYMQRHPHDVARKQEQVRAKQQLQADEQQRLLQQAQEAERRRQLKEKNEQIRAQNAARRDAAIQKQNAQREFYEMMESKKQEKRLEHDQVQQELDNEAKRAHWRDIDNRGLTPAQAAGQPGTSLPPPPPQAIPAPSSEAAPAPAEEEPEQAVPLPQGGDTGQSPY